MTIFTEFSHDPSRLLRVVYASHATSPMTRDDLAAMVRHAARYNRTVDISGVLVCGGGLFLQWLEGPASVICALMHKISSDPRHTGVTILSAGWIGQRRFAGWSMNLVPESDRLGRMAAQAGHGTADVRLPTVASQTFDDLALVHQFAQTPARDLAQAIAAFVPALCCEPTEPPLPDMTRHCLRTRAHIVDEAMRLIGIGAEQDQWSSAATTVAMARLHGLFQRAGRVPDPIRPRSHAYVVLPPGSPEVLTAVVKTDLLRAAGISVRMVIEQDCDVILSMVDVEPDAPILVAGSRLALDDPEGRAPAFADWLHQRRPDRIAYLGGRRAGPLAQWPERLDLRTQRTGRLAASAVEWLALSGLASVAERSRPVTLHG